MVNQSDGNGRAQRHKRHGERRGTRGKPRPKANRILKSFRRSLRQALQGEVRPVSELWDGIELSEDDLLKAAVALGVSVTEIRAGVEQVIKWGRENHG